MTASQFRALFLVWCIGSATFGACEPIRAEDWITRDGKAYKGVKVVKVEDDAVTILCDDGGARVSLALLPSDLQQRFHYEPAKAQAAKARYDADQRSSDEALAHEKEQVEAAKQKSDNEIRAERQKSAEQAEQQRKQQIADVAVQQIKDLATSRATWISGKVVAVIPLDKLGNNSYLVDQFDISTGIQLPSGTVVLVAGGVNDGYVDGDTLGSGMTQHGSMATGDMTYTRNLWYYAGVYRYTSAAGSTVTCRIYSPSLEWAVRNLSEQSN